MGPFTSNLLAAFAPWLQYDTNGDLTAYLSLLGAMFDAVATLVYAQGYVGDPDFVPSWSVLLDPENCPTFALPFLGQFVGVFVPPGTDDATARSLITQEAGFQRGTPAAIKAAAQRWLSGTQAITMLERTPDAYSFQIIVRPEQIINTNALVSAVNAVKPAGLVWELLSTDGFLLFELEADYTPISTVESTFVTIQGMENDVPGT